MSLIASLRRFRILIVLSIVSFKSTHSQNAFPFFNQQQNFNNQRQRQPNQFGFYPQQFPFNNFGFQNGFQTFAPQNQQNFNQPNYQQPNHHNYNNFQQPQNHQQPTHQQSNNQQIHRPQSPTTLKQPLITTVRPVQTTQQTFDRVSQRSKFRTSRKKGTHLTVST